MPRGVAIPEVKEHLFQAAERLLLRSGAERFSSRTIAAEAGVAKGLLFNHFADLDQFLAELVLDRARTAGRETTALTAKAGSGDVAANLADTAASLFRSPVFAIVAIVHSRPSIMARLHQTGPGRPFHLLGDVEKAFKDYLDAERTAGRIAAGIDTETLAMTLVGTLHYGFITGRVDEANVSAHIQRIVGCLSDSRPRGGGTRRTPSRGSRRHTRT
jgi:AcrR family transcriptional regulator